LAGKSFFCLSEALACSFALSSLAQEGKTIKRDVMSSKLRSERERVIITFILKILAVKTQNNQQHYYFQDT
jgi:hypothetical protein